jgi:hypothetical protein
MKAAIRKYRQFHQFDPVEKGEFHPTFKIPTQAIRCGEGVYVLYSSDKLNPETGEDEGVIDYIHHHDPGVKVYRTDPDSDGPMRPVPQSIRRVKILVLLGKCAGFAYKDHNGKEVKADATGRAPELYTIPSGKALLVVQDKRTCLALIWGGKLGVKPEGIVG